MGFRKENKLQIDGPRLKLQGNHLIFGQNSSRDWLKILDSQNLGSFSASPKDLARPCAAKK